MKNIDKPYFLCVDEMNLARVEYYFSDILSSIETRNIKDDKIITQRLLIRTQLLECIPIMVTVERIKSYV
ncbi:hypothetical protein LL037_12510 [Clostridium estertheticum]|uniref:hypothetical protein n=1 Tax=Clostridium estertheticum TaxID=238834 RepID=UPI001C0D5F1B|nr:hypothetical protein [Clostridium estertheticum]MBU3202209.1 hypothetical protein [Clostridium estertheticum]WAG67904.1 hypothetical protein LL037_12510 [Clostridium estertheticum]